ncbi:MAG: hypothetical protein JWR16_199, partial [Nevskia sp.]|nr:hypothetical protein [Nevskia sp.]
TPSELTFTGWRWSAEEIAGDVGNFNLAWEPRMVFLNACRTAAAPGINSSLADTFLPCAQAVVAMQGDIRGSAAGALAGEFYKWLADSLPINEALSRARGIIAGAGEYRQAAFARLTMRCAPAAALPSFKPLPANYAARAGQCKLLPSLRTFVNQVEPRRRLCGGFWPVREEDPLRRFVVLHGDPGNGKSLLSAWLLDLGLRHGHQVRYVKLEDESGGVSCVKALDLIWNAGSPTASPLTDPLPALPQALAQALRSSNDIALFAPFRQALCQVSTNRPVTIVFDQLQQKMDPGGFWALWEHLLIPVASGELPNVHFVLALSKEDWIHYRVEEQLKNQPEFNVQRNQIQLQGLSSAEFVARFREYANYRSTIFSEPAGLSMLDPMLKLMADNLPTSSPISSMEEKLVQVTKFFNIPLEPVRLT